MKINNRIRNLQQYHFKILDEIKKKRKEDGKVVVDLSIGDPDLDVHPNILKALVDGFNIEGFNKYPPYDGTLELKKEVIRHYKDTFNVELTLDEVIILIGSKEGISSVIPAVCDIGDVVLVPEPGYPVYSIASNLWGCKPHTIPLKEKKRYLMELKEIPEHISSRAKLFFINYPNNPTGATGNEEFFREIIAYCREKNIILCNDAAYNEIIPLEEKPISILQFDEERKSIEFGSFSKLYNMTGFRIGYAVGASEVINALSKIKSNLDSGQFIPIQKAAYASLNLSEEYKNNIKRTYATRRIEVEKILEEKNIKFFNTNATFYIWCRTPKDYTTHEFCSELINKHGIVVTPGSVFGDLGYDYFRISLTNDIETTKNALLMLDKYN
ncbi:aminotransferase class I/II-fold pyridoxal phosphate-dependent enzyme [Clostridium sp. Marseille-QA1073]